MKDNFKLVLIDDEDQFRFMTRMSLESDGFQVLEAGDGNKGLELVRSDRPDLVLLDLNMPEPDGHKVCDMIKSDQNLRQIPVIILTTSDDLNDKLSRLDGGADDYITKNTDPKERSARIRAVIRRNLQNLDSNPLTHLPGNNKIQDMIETKVQCNEQFAVAYTDLDNFKAYNDKYGFKQGDEVILFTANSIKRAVEKYGDGTEFVGHIGGDDFVVISQATFMNSIGEEIIRLIDEGIVEYYEESDREKRHITTTNRQGDVQKFPFVSISIAVVNNLYHTFTNIGEIVKIVTELKKFAKQKEGSCLVFDKRAER